MSTDEIQPDIGFFFDAMSVPLSEASTQYEVDGRFPEIASLVETISAEWPRDDARTGINLDTLGRTLAGVQQSHPTDSNVTSLVQFYVGLQTFRSGPWYSPGKPPPAPAAARTGTKLTVFDVAGTSLASVLTAGGAPTTAQTPPSWNLANMVSADITVMEVPYPACVPFGASYRAGATTLATMINNTKGPFAMVGTSQGAMVTARVYERILDHNDALHSRNGDFMQGITYGNPCRKRGSIAPGCVDPGGRGINWKSWLMTTLDDRWWDFVNPGDPAACNGAGPWDVDGLHLDYQGSVGDWAATLFLEMYKNFSGNLAALILGLNPPKKFFSLLLSVFETLVGVGGPHNAYDQTTPDSNQPALTCTQLAAQQLNSIAAQLP
jgi:hypothetical protein